MAHFYGTIAGGRGEASRLGHKATGIHATAASYSGAVQVSLVHRDGKDIAIVSLNVIDSRDVIERIAELEAICKPIHNIETGEDELDPAYDDDERQDAAAELAALEALAAEAEGYVPDWKYGAMLIRDSYFEDYAQELAEDLGLIKSDAAWPSDCIDWEKAARELRMDYTSVEFDGVTYWVR